MLASIRGRAAADGRGASLATALLVFLALSTVTRVATAQTPAPVTVQTDIAYTFQNGEDILLDAYLPETDGPHPAVLWIHGGRWAGGDKSQDADLIEALAAEGFAVFSINYRIVKEEPYPAAVEDAQEAVRWVRENAEEYDVDPERVGAIGVSSGAHLAALLATLEEGPPTEDARIAAAVSLSGPMDLVAAQLEPGNLRSTVEEFLDCTGTECEAVAGEASPITHVDETDAPVLLVNSGEEIIPVEQATAMATALDAVGVENGVLLVPGTEHASAVVGGSKPGAPDVQEAYTGFLLEHVAGIEGAFQSDDDLEEAVPTPSPTEESPEPDTSPVAAPPVDPGGGSTWLAYGFLLLALAAIVGSAGWYVRKRRLARQPY